MKRLTKRIGPVAIICLLINGISGAWAQGKNPTSAPDLAAYTGADREQRLLAGAKTEGKVVWYTSLAGSSYKELAKGFESEISRRQDRTLSRHQLGHHDQNQRRGSGQADHRRCDRDHAADACAFCARTSF